MDGTERVFSRGGCLLGFVVKIIGTIILGALLAYKINFTLLIGDGDVPQNPVLVLNKAVGIITGVLYSLVINILIFLLQIQCGYILVVDLVLFLLLVAYIDFKHRIIPNRINIAFFLSQIICVYMIVEESIAILNFVFAALLLGCLTFVSYKTSEAIGMGDAKMLVILNCIYGLSFVLYTSIISMFIILLSLIPFVIMKKVNLKTGIPFAPYYLLGTLVYYIISLV